LSRRILAVPSGPDDPVLDVGSGTGIFTRQLAGHLPGVPVIGVEPAEAMRDKASRTEGPANIRYETGFAEKLPFPEAGVRAVVSATAAHWFDRPGHYAEAARVLATGGILAVVQYVRDAERSPAAAAIEDFLAENGGERVYARPDYKAELETLDPFGPVDATYDSVTLQLSIPDFAGLALSSSHARPVVARLGQEGAENALAEVGAGLVGANGTIPYGFRFEMFIVERIGRG